MLQYVFVPQIFATILTKQDMEREIIKGNLQCRIYASLLNLLAVA
jgi:hypothetical protein